MNIGKLQPTLIGTNIWINPKVVFGENVRIGHSSCIGFPTKENDDDCEIKNDVEIGSFCFISMGTTIEKNVNIDNYSSIKRGSSIGHHTRLLYGARISEDVKIGHDCRIGGNCPDRTIMGNYVTHMGRIAHSYTDPNLDWDLTKEISPIIEDGVVIGVGALIIGGVRIGSKSYITSGSIVKHDIPAETVFAKGKCIPYHEWKGRLKLHSLGAKNE